MFNFNFLFQLFNRPRRISWTRWLRCTSPSGLAKISSLSRVKTPRCCGPIWPTNCQIRSLFRSTLTKASFQKCERKLRKEVENWLIMTRRDITFRHYRQIPTEMRPNMQGITPMKWSLSHSMFGGIISLFVEFQTLVIINQFILEWSYQYSRDTNFSKSLNWQCNFWT